MALQRSVLVRLREIAGHNNVDDSPESRLAHSADATAMKPVLPAVVVRPADAAQVSDILKLANSGHFPVVPRGSGTGLSGGAIPSADSVVLLLNHWNRILEFDTENLSILAEPGVITATIHREAEDRGLLYPPDPGSSSISTIGGNVAENAGGLRGLKYGVTKQYILGMEVVLPDGTILQTGGKSVKDVAGFDLKSVMIGSEGTLGIITKVLLKVIPKPAAYRTILAFFPTVGDAAATVSDVIAARITPAMLEFLDNTTIRSVEAYARLGLPVESGAILLMEVDGHPAVVEQDTERITTVCRSHHATDFRTAGTEAESIRLKAARRAALASLARTTPTTIMEDVAVPRADLARLVERIGQISRKYDVRIGNFGHAGDGNLHPNYLTDARDASAYARAERAVIEVEESAIEFGGTITGEHGVGLYKKRMLPRMVGTPAISMMQTLKRMMDPNNILNPGKVIDIAPRCEGKLPVDPARILEFDETAWM